MTRKRVLTAVFVFFAVVTAVILSDVLATVFFAITVSYVFAPVYRQFVRRGLPRWWASGATTGIVLVSSLAIVAPPFFIVYLRRHELIAAIRGLPDTVTLQFGEYATTVTVDQAWAMARVFLRDVGLSLAGGAPSLAVKFGLFLLVVFGLFLGFGRARRAALALVPDEHEDVFETLAGRSYDTLWAIYVLQGLTAVGTFLIAVPVFFVLGYKYPIAMATVCGILQFIPIVGPSLLIAVVAAFHLVSGQIQEAVLVAVVAGALVAWLPDPLIRPRFSREVANLPGTLYFVGFTGGVFSLGPIGVIAGPLVVALFAESVRLLADELRNDHGSLEESDVLGTDDA